MIPLDEARAHVLGAVRPLPPVEVPVGAADGCVTAEAIVSPEDVPAFDNTAVDGYAVRAADVAAATVEQPVVLAVAGLLPAGVPPSIPVEPGTAVRIMTGAAMPPGADAVVMVEDTVTVGERVEIRRSVDPGASVRRAGDDVRAGDLVFPEGTVLGPPHLGVLASIGRLIVAVVPRARVGVLSTGDELVEDGSPLEPGQVRESNRTMLLALVERAGTLPVDLGLARDDEASLTAVLERAAETCDAVITSGGVSMGDFDLVKVVLDRVGDMRWMQIAIKPAKPFAFGLLGERRVPVFGLPGNPVSSMVSFELFARPALRLMMGHQRLDRPEVLAVADEGLPRRRDGKLHLLRVIGGFGADGRYHVRTVGAQGSHQLAASALADALAVVPDGPGIPPGGEVLVRLLVEH